MKYMYKKWQEYPASTQDKRAMKKRICKTWSMAWIMKMVRIRVKRRKAMAREEECSFSAEPWFNKTLVTRSPFSWARVSYFFRQNNILNSFFCDIGLLWDFCDILRIRYRLKKYDDKRMQGKYFDITTSSFSDWDALSSWSSELWSVFSGSEFKGAAKVVVVDFVSTSPGGGSPAQTLPFCVSSFSYSIFFVRSYLRAGGYDTQE